MSGSFVKHSVYCVVHDNEYPYGSSCEKCVAQQKPPLQTQVSGSHYKDLKIQPVEYIHGNGIPFIEGCVIKYVTRWRAKGGVDDLKKARHFLDILIDLETRDAGT
jgi:hypothetical protein